MPRRYKNSNNRKNFIFFVLAVVVIFLNVNQKDSNKKISQEKTSPEKIRHTVKLKKASPEHSKIAQKLNQAVALEKNKKYSEAVALFNEITAEISQSKTLNNEYKAYIWELKTNLHLRLWQHADAKMAVVEALRLGSAKQIKNLKQRADWLSNVIEKINLERNKKTAYIASPFVGPSKKFTGEIGIIHIFLEDKNSRSWGLKQRTISLTAMNKAKEWFKKEVSKYKKSVTFKQRIYLINRNPAIKRMSIGTEKKHIRDSMVLAKLAVKQLGATSIRDFLNSQKAKMQTDEVMLLLHLNKKGRSFAKRCLFNCGASGEYTYILENAVVKQWQAMEYAQAHETLHLFGADDLYNIKGSIFFATRDIMNYTSKYLDASIIEPITAYGIGLITTKPKTPFKINFIR